MDFFLKTKLKKSEEFVELFNCALAVVRFCYSQDGAWIGTENIKADDVFIELMYNLHNALKPFMRGLVDFERKVN